MRQTVQAEAGVADPFQGRADRKVDVLRARWLETTASFHTLPCTRNEGAFRGSAQLLPGRHAVAPREYRRAIARHPNGLPPVRARAGVAVWVAHHTGENREENVFDRRKIGCTEHIEED